MECTNVNLRQANNIYIHRLSTENKKVSKVNNVIDYCLCFSIPINCKCLLKGVFKIV